MTAGAITVADSQNREYSGVHSFATHPYANTPFSPVEANPVCKVIHVAEQQ